MSPELIAIIGTGVALAGLNVTATPPVRRYVPSHSAGRGRALRTKHDTG